MRDVEATLAEALGAEAALSKSTVPRICQQIAEQFDAWRTRRLDLLCLDYLFLDDSHIKIHPGSPAEPILTAEAPPPTANRYWSPSRSPQARATTPGTTSSTPWPTAGCARRYWPSATARPGW